MAEADPTVDCLGQRWYILPGLPEQNACSPLHTEALGDSVLTSTILLSIRGVTALVEGMHRPQSSAPQFEVIRKPTKQPAHRTELLVSLNCGVCGVFCTGKAKSLVKTCFALTWDCGYPPP